MSIERISTIQTASVITQPKPDAVEPLTLIEKLEQEKEWWHDDGENNAHRIIDDCIDIVKQHSEWMPVSELKLTEDDYGKDFIAYECEYFKTTGRATYQDGGYWRFDCARGYCASANISHVIPIPKFQPPSEVQDD